MTGSVTRLTVSQLGARTRLAQGGQGFVYTAPGIAMRQVSGMVYKEYLATLRPRVDVAVLESMPEFLARLPDGMELLSRAAWPCRLVEDAPGRVSGFVMPSIPGHFSVEMQLSAGMSRSLASVQLLLNGEEFLANRRIGLTDRLRYQLLLDAARTLDFFHGHDITVGDLSPKNLYFSLSPPQVYFIECDAMAVAGRSVLEQMETPDWQIVVGHPGEEKATVASDSYKLGLLALRLLVSDQVTTDSRRLPLAVPALVRTLIRAAIDEGPSGRPKPADWHDALGAAAATATTTLPRKPKPAPPQQYPRQGLATQPRPTPTWQAPAAPPRPPAFPPPGSGPPPGWPGPLPPPGLGTGTGPRFSGRQLFALVAVAVVGLVIAVLLWGTPEPPSPGSGRPTTVGPGITRTPETSPANSVAVGKSPNGVAIDPGAHLAYVANSVGNSVSVIDMASKAVAATIAVGKSPSALAVDTDAHTLYVTDQDDNTLSVIDTNTRAVVATVPVGKNPSGVAVDFGAHVAYVANLGENSVSVLDATTRTVTATLSGLKGAIAVAVDPGSHRAYVADRDSNSVSVLDPATHAVTATITVGKGPFSLAVDPLSHNVFVTNINDRTLSVIAGATGAVTPVTVGPHSLNSVAVDSATHTVYATDSGFGEFAVYVIDANAHTVTTTIPVARTPRGIAVDPATHNAYVTIDNFDAVTVIAR
ncbi:YncE family protein [Nocardia yunnanensis]|nr:YncE family protein [Nocardia yunnanensis]